MKIPYPSGISGLNAFPELQEFLVNLFAVEEGLIQTPGISSFTTGNNICRGMTKWNDEVFTVSGSSLAKIASDGTFSSIGGISGTAHCEMATDYTVMAIVQQGGSGTGYVYDGSTLAAITDGDYQASIDVVNIGGRFVFVPADGGPLFYTDVNGLTVATVATCIPAGNFFDAELLPDKNVGAVVIKNNLYALGQDICELFRLTPDTVLPFKRVDQGAVHTGYIGGKCFYQNTFAFIGRDREGAPDAFIMQPGEALSISNPAIQEILASYSESDLQNIRPMRYTWKKCQVIVWRLSNVTLAFCNGNWVYIRSGNGDNYRANYMTPAYDTYVVGDAVTNQFGKLADVPTEYTAPVEREIETFAHFEKGSFVGVNAIELDCRTGTMPVEGRIGLKVSRDNEIFGQPVWRSLGKHGKRHQRVLWTGGVGNFESHIGVNLRTTADVEFSTKELTAVLEKDKQVA